MAVAVSCEYQGLSWMSCTADIWLKHRSDGSCLLSISRLASTSVLCDGTNPGSDLSKATSQTSRSVSKREPQHATDMSKPVLLFSPQK
eukprot:883068-Amorphochlora_amoeboformis.AAC.1